MTVETLTKLEQLRAKRTEELNELATFAEKRAEARDAFEKRETSDEAKPSDEERSAFVVAEEEYQKEFKSRESGLESLSQRISEEKVIEERRQDAANASRGVSITDMRQPLTYRKDNAENVSYFRDLASRYHASFASQYADTQGAHERLEIHGKEMADEMPKRERARQIEAERRVDQAERDLTGSIHGIQRRGLDASPFERRVNPNRTDGQGGYLVKVAA